MISLSADQERQVYEELKAGWFWNVVQHVRLWTGCSFQEAFKFVEEKADALNT